MSDDQVPVLTKARCGHLISAFRAYRGLSQTEAARRMSVPVHRLKAWEVGRSSPGLEGLQRLSLVLGVRLDTFVFELKATALGLWESAIQLEEAKVKGKEPRLTVKVLGPFSSEDETRRKAILLATLGLLLAPEAKPAVKR